MVTVFEWGHELPRLRGHNVDLRALADSDAPAILATFGDRDVMEFWSSPPLADLAAATALIGDIRTSFMQRRFFQWGIVFRETGDVVGTCTLFNVELEHRRAEIGFALRRAVWGKGLARDAVEALIRFAFMTMELHRLEADTDPRNQRSLKLLERQGFRREGYLRERWHHLGRVDDAISLGLLRREWSPGIHGP